MARVTVEDCVDKVPNRFELVLLSAHRARTISSGASILVDRDNDKNPVVALREIAVEKLKPAQLREDFVTSLQRHADLAEAEEKAPQLTGPEAPLEGETMNISEEELLRGLRSETQKRAEAEDEGSDADI